MAVYTPHPGSRTAGTAVEKLANCPSAHAERSVRRAPARRPNAPAPPPSPLRTAARPATSASRGAVASRSETCGSAIGHSTADVRVVPGDPAPRSPGRSRLEQLVVDVGDLAEDAEAVGEADRDEELAVALVVELVALPLPVGRRAAAQVDGDVADPRRAGSAPASPARARSGSAGRAGCPALEREWLSWTNSPSTPSSRQASALKVSTRKPRSSPWTVRLEQDQAVEPWSRVAVGISSGPSRTGARSTRGTRPSGSAPTTTRCRGTSRPCARCPRRSATCGLPAERLGLRRRRASSGGRGRGGR